MKYKLINKLRSSDFFKKHIYSIISSIIAAIIFWGIFSYIPEMSRINKIRAKVDLNMYQVYINMFSLFDQIMRFNNHSPSNYQEKIRGNRLDRSDIELGLQNKCLNEYYLFDININKLLLPIGHNLYDRIKLIDSIIERIFNFSSCLSSDEILLLEGIRTQLHIYDLENYNKKALIVLGDTNFYPVNPSLSYMTDNFYELFQLHIKLQDAVFRNDFENRDLFLIKINTIFIVVNMLHALVKSIKNQKNILTKKIS